VKRLSLDKALTALSLLKGNRSEKQHVVPSSDTVVLDSDIVVLGSDTVVVSQGQVLEKPSDFADSKRMLTQLANKRHQV
ncbi:Maf family protein, partial [Vibrio sp. 10N.222.55.E8]